MEEIWKIIEEFPNYSVSNFGRVKNNNSDYVFVGGKDRNGYNQVTLSTKEGKQYSRRVCRLVAKAFIPNPDDLPQVNHKDEDVSNDNIENLEWCTCKYNNNYMNHPKRMAKPVKCLETGESYYGAREAARETNGTHAGILRSCKLNVPYREQNWIFI